MVTTLVMVVALPMVALAADTFTDVPNSNVFHGNINNLYASRVTTGCGGTNFCPKTEVTREQMAAFLNRGLPRAAGKGHTAATANEVRTTATVETFTIRTGDVAGGTVFLLVTGDVSVTTSTNGTCPCGLRAQVWVDGVASQAAYTTITNTAAPVLGLSANWRMGNATVTSVFAVSSGATHTVDLRYDLTRTNAGVVSVQSNLSAVYAPFGPLGTDDPAPISVPSGPSGSPADPMSQP